MPIETKTTFSIEGVERPSTKQPFGPKYAGNFTIRRPSLLDKKNIAVRNAASLSFAGHINPGLLQDDIVIITHTHNHILTLAEEKVPEWFDISTMTEDDEEAVFAVWQEVDRFLAGFRPGATGGNGSAGDTKP